MASLRRRASRRVVKSTFQECFEYDIPGFRGVEGNRPSVAAARNRSIQNTKAKPKQESSSKSMKHSVDKNERIKKPTTNIEKGKSKNVEHKLKEKTLKNNNSDRLRKVKNSLMSIRKAKNTILSSNNKRLKAPLTNNTEKSKTPKKNELPSKTSSKSSPAEKQNFESNTWQPVVSLEKLSVNTTKSSKSPEKSKRMTPKNQYSRQSSSETLALAVRLKNALKDPMAEREDMESNLPSAKTPNSALVEVLKETRAIKARTAMSRKTLQEEEGVSSPKKVAKNISDTVFENKRNSVKHPESDSALEDWPESTSEASEESPYKDLEDLASSSATNDWSSPHVPLIIHWQNQFNSVTNDLKSSFDSLKSIIEEKNSLIVALKDKLNCYSDSTCHKILDNILLDYDKHDLKNPATAIINSILEYPNSHC